MLSSRCMPNGIDGSRKMAGAMEEREELESDCCQTVTTAMGESDMASNVVKAFKSTTTQVDPTK